MKSQVYLVKITAAEPACAWDAALRRLAAASGLAGICKPGDLTAVKLHFGEDGANTHMQPHMVRPLVAELQAAGAHPFLTDTATLYVGSRSNAVNHALTAAKHGFTVENTGAPVVLADGLFGNSEIEVPAPAAARHYRGVRLAADLVRANSMLVVSHATGHCECAFGAALKNVGMGCSSRKGKMSQHAALKPSVKLEACIACGICAKWCPAAAITMTAPGGRARIAEDKCIGCGECLSMCPHGAVGFDWGYGGAELQERMAEHAAAMHLQKAPAVAYVNLAVNITRECDCFGIVQQPVTPDVGALASFDPVALDMATLDLTRDKQGRHFAELQRPDYDATVAIRYAASLGIGSTDYELIRL